MVIGRGYNPVCSEVPNTSLLEFFVCIKEFLYAGSDMKRVLEKKLKITRELCQPHLIHLVIQDAFGSSSKDKKSRRIKKLTVYKGYEASLRNI